MALCHLPNVTCISQKLFCFHPSLNAIEEHYLASWEAQYRTACRGVSVVCSAKTPRTATKSKPSISDAELCKEIRQFVSTEGLPENHIPSIAELSRRGRKDLANIVRRKGYKIVQKLLRNQTNIDAHMERNLPENQHSVSNELESSDVQDRSLNALVEDTSSSRLSLMKKCVHSRNDTVAFNACLQSDESSESLVGILNETSMNLTQIEESNTDSFISQESAVSPEEWSVRDSAFVEVRPRADVDVNAISEVEDIDKEAEINHLKAMLHKKEMELSLLKQEIEIEKMALSSSQNKANAEMSNMLSIISAKDAKLRAAEEVLLGLKEVQIEYQGNGEVVEVAGSFNGWHHWIKMDRHSLSSTLGFSETRESISWSVTLWLYPGIYELKFVVDGHWIIDSQRELLTRGHITNNILRVER